MPARWHNPARMKVFGAVSAGKRPKHPWSSPVAMGLAGPLSIVVLVLVVLHDVAFGGMVSDRNPDLLAFWMPNQCLLGQELTGGRIPYWNPHALAGTPFAADPQSGWMYLPMMALSVLSCDLALRALVVFFPILAGLGGYAFLRGEGASRAGATVTGLALAGVTAGSALAVTLTFVGFIAWTPWLLAAAAKTLSAASWPARLGWATATALVWGQLAAAHISNGLVMGSVLLVAYWIYRSLGEVRAGRLRTHVVVGLALLVALLLVAVNLAYLLPRFMYLQRSTIGLGYEGLFELRNELWGLPPTDPPLVRVTEPQWILRLSTSPGAYLGALALALSFAGLFVRRWRGLALLLWAYVLGFYAIGTRSVAEFLQPLIGETFLGDFYGHAPARFGYAPILGLCVLAGVGVEAVRSRASRDEAVRAEASKLRLLVWVAPGVLLWGAGPLLAGAEAAHLWLFASGAAVAAGLFVIVRRPGLAWSLLAATAALELAVNGLYGQSRTWERAGHGLTDPRIVGVEPLPEPDVDPAAFAAELPTLGGLESPPRERWITMDPTLQLLGRQIVHGVNEAQGYNPVQLRRYWTYTRAVAQRGGVDPRPRLTVFDDVLDADALDLLDVGYVATEADEPPGDAFRRVSRGDGWTVWAVADPSPPASFFASYVLLPSAQANLEAVTDPAFEARRDLVVERRGISAEVSHAPEQAADLRWIDASTAEIAIEPDIHGYLLARVPYDDHWAAEVDGRDAPVFPGNYFLQVVEVRPGDRSVRLSYRDPWVLRGLWGSAAVLATVTAVGGALRAARRRRSPQDPARPDGREAETSTPST